MGGAVDDEDNRDHKLLTLGNLAIITASLNSSIRDAEWSKKLEGNGSKKGLRAYSSGLDTMAFVLSTTSWDEEKISDRADWLADKIIESWPSYAYGGEEVVEENEEITQINIAVETQPSVKKKKNVNNDRTLFSLNGSGYVSKAKFVRLVVKEYMHKYPESTFPMLKQIFRVELLETGYKHKGLLCPVEVWEAWVNENKAKRYYVSGDDSVFCSYDGQKFYINTQWTLKSVKAIVEIAEREGFTVESVQP